MGTGHRLSARQALSEALAAGPVVICPVVYAELAAGFGSREELARFAHDLELKLEHFSTDALPLAANAWKSYTRARGLRLPCQRCGQLTVVHCPACQSPLAWRQHIIPDFLVGGHAARQADRLLTRDAVYYRVYFPSLQLMQPAPAA